MYRSGMGGMDRDFGHSDMSMNRGFGDSLGGMGNGSSDFKQFYINFILKVNTIHH